MEVIGADMEEEITAYFLGYLVDRIVSFMLECSDEPRSATINHQSGTEKEEAK